MKTCTIESLPGEERIFKLSQNIIFLQGKYSIYPFVQVEQSKKGLRITHNEYIEILNFVENNGLEAI